MAKPTKVASATTTHTITKVNLGMIIVLSVFNVIFLGALLVKGLFSAFA